MTEILKLSIALCIAFLWIGFVSSISFMEAWLKFKAKGVTLGVGLSIGRLIFKVLNAIEWVFALIIFLCLFSNNLNTPFIIPELYLIILLLLLQSFYMLPGLDSRALRQINGEKLKRSNLHLYYVGEELIKVACLLIFGIHLLNYLLK